VKFLIQVLVAGLVCCIGNAAHATIVTYNYKSTVGYITERLIPNGDYEQVAESNIAGKPVAIGDILIGSFQYDTSVGLSSYQPQQEPGLNYRLYKSAENDYISYVDVTTGLALASQPSLNFLGLTQIYDHVAIPGVYSGDFFSMKLNMSNEIVFASMGVYFSDMFGTALQSAAMPEELDINAFEYPTVNSSFLRQSDGAYMYFWATITSLERVEADVPEPSTAFLFALGAGGLFGLRRLRRA
jgi:hypothetical protein